jgi:hypothetical protein
MIRRALPANAKFQIPTSKPERILWNLDCGIWNPVASWYSRVELSGKAGPALPVAD